MVLLPVVVVMATMSPAIAMVSHLVARVMASSLVAAATKIMSPAVAMAFWPDVVVTKIIYRAVVMRTT
jgi:hypothetical protein